MTKNFLACRRHKLYGGWRRVKQAWLVLLLSALSLGMEGGQLGQAADITGKITAEDVKKESQEAVETTRKYTAQQKEAFHRKAQAELDEMQAKIDKLKEKASNASEKAKAEMQKKVRELEKQKEAAGKKLEELKSASTEAWGDLKSGMSNALDDLKQSYKRALSRLD